MWNFLFYDTLGKLFLALLKKERKAWQTQRKWKLGFISNHRNNRALWHILSSSVGTLLIIIALQNPIPPRNGLELQVNVKCLNLLLFLLCKERERGRRKMVGNDGSPRNSAPEEGCGGQAVSGSPSWTHPGTQGSFLRGKPSALCSQWKGRNHL